MSPRVLAHVIGHPHDRTVKASLKGFHRYCIQDRTYPALCRSEKTDVVVHGVLVTDLSDEDVRALDDFEGSDYIRTAVQVTLADGTGKVVDTYAYLWAKGESDPELYGTWSFEKDFLPREEETLRGWGFL